MLSSRLGGYVIANVLHLSTGIRLSTFDAVKGLLQESEKAYHEESAALQTKRFKGL